MSTAVWHGRRVVVCVGTGGVGKTTVAAALAMAAAAAGRRVVVMTIDPSRRLSQALGLAGVSHEPQPVDLAPLAGQGPAATPGGSLHALILDVQHTFDSLIRRRAPSAEAAQRILSNRIYSHFSASLAGSHEYAAVEKLWDVYQDPAYDLVVLDTPPSQHAIDFLDAPGRILRFLQGHDDSAADAKPSLARKVTARLFDMGGTLVSRTVGRVSGAQTLTEVTGFLQSLRDMYASFHERATGVGALLQGREAAFLLVGGPAPAQVSALTAFAGELTRFGIEPAGWVLNRMHTAAMDPAHADTLAAALAALAPKDQAPPWLAALRRAIDQEVALAGRDEAQRAQLAADHPSSPIYAISEVPKGAESVVQLAALAREFYA